MRRVRGHCEHLNCRLLCVSRRLEKREERRNVQSEECSVWLRVREQCLLPHNICYRGIKVQGSCESVDSILAGDVAAIMGKKVMVCEGVHHGARAADCFG